MKHLSSNIKAAVRRVFFLSFIMLVANSNAIAAEGDQSSGDKLNRLLKDPNASIASVESSPFRRSRYFIGGGLGIIAPDDNRLVDGLAGSSTSRATVTYRAVAGIDFSPRLSFYWEGDYHTFSDKQGFTAYSIVTSMGSARLNFLRTRGFVPYGKASAGLAYTDRNLSKQFSSSSKEVTVGTDTTMVFDFGLGLMYDKPVSWLANGDVRLLLEVSTRRDNNDKATPVTYFQETFASLNVEYLFGSSVFQGDKIIIERDVTTDDGGEGGMFRKKRNPVLYPSAAELAALSDTSRPNIIFFQQYSSYLVDTQKPKLDAIVEQLQENPNLQVTVTGHADANDFIYDKVERLKFNRAISGKRSVSVRHYLVRKGIDPERVTLQWRGDQQRVTKGENAEQRSLNRRADVIVR